MEGALKELPGTSKVIINLATNKANLTYDPQLVKLVGLAIGSGKDVAKETGDVILIKDDIRDVVVALEIAKATMRKVKQNLFWAFFYNTQGIPLGEGLFYPFASLVISPEIAGLMMAVSSISDQSQHRLETINSVQET